MTLLPNTTTMINRRFKRAIAKVFVQRIFGRQAEVAELSLPSVQPPGGTQDINSLPNTRDFIANYPIFVRGQENHNTVDLAMELLSKRIIDDIAYDTSARTLHPCLPRTRLRLHKRIINWFYDKERRQSVLWLNALAGVRISVIIQALAESLAPSKNLGAALFLSGASSYNDAQRILITVAFQLAVRIPSYSTFVAEQITHDPGVLEGEIKDQFRMFITEPFGRRMIGEGEGPWGILLDGLDECESPDLESEIVRLIGEFILSFPRAPLVWVIASRPQPHLGSAFTSEAMLPIHWSEYIQSDSDQGEEMRGSEWRSTRRREERLLFTGFKVIRRWFSHLPSEWPSEIQMAKLTEFVTAPSFPIKTLVRFIADTNYADPISRLNQVISVIEPSGKAITSHSRTAPSRSDVLYALILLSIPPDLWEATKQVLGFLLCGQWSQSGSLRAMSTILGLEKSVISQSLHALQSVLRTESPPSSPDDLPPPYSQRPAKYVAPKHHTVFSISYPLRNRRVWGMHIMESNLYLLSPFVDFLMDPVRSQGNFNGYQYRSNVALTYYKIYLDAPWKSDSNFRFRSLVMQCVYYLLTGEYTKHPGRSQLLDAELRSECLDLLSQINVIELYLHGSWAGDFSRWLIKLWEKFSDEFRSKGLVEEVQLRDLTFNHLDCRGNKPVYAYDFNDVTDVETFKVPWTLWTSTSKLRAFQRVSPTLKVLICGSIPERRNALFTIQYTGHTRYYCIPYPY